MDISFANNKLKRDCNDTRRLVQRYGPRRAEKIRRRLDDLAAAETLAVMRALPGRCHELLGDRKGQLSVDLEHPYRLIFTPEGEGELTKPDGGLDWTLVRAVCIQGVEDTHD